MKTRFFCHRRRRSPTPPQITPLFMDQLSILSTLSVPPRPRVSPAANSHVRGWCLHEIWASIVCEIWRDERALESDTWEHRIRAWSNSPSFLPSFLSCEQLNSIEGIMAIKYMFVITLYLLTHKIPCLSRVTQILLNLPFFLSFNTKSSLSSTWLLI